MESKCCSETSVEFQYTTRKYIDEERTLQDFELRNHFCGHSTSRVTYYTRLYNNFAGITHCSVRSRALTIKIQRKCSKYLTFVITAGHNERDRISACLSCSEFYTTTIITTQIMLQFTCWQHRGNTYRENSKTANYYCARSDTNIYISMLFNDASTVAVMQFFWLSLRLLGTAK
jgi:hypothetical protein